MTDAASAKPMSALEQKVAKALHACEWRAGKNRVGFPPLENESAEMREYWITSARAAIDAVLAELCYELCYGCAEKLPLNGLGQHERHAGNTVMLLPCHATLIHAAFERSQRGEG